MAKHTRTPIESVDDVFRAYFCPVIALVGMLTNVLCVVVFARMRLTRFSVFVITLSLASFFILLVNTFLDDFMGRGLHYATRAHTFIKLDTWSTNHCRFMEFLPNLMYFIAAYTIVAFSVDRVLLLYQVVQTKKNQQHLKIAGGICVLIVFLGLILAAPLAISYELQHDDPINALKRRTSSHHSSSSSSLSSTSATTAPHAGIQSSTQSDKQAHPPACTFSPSTSTFGKFPIYFKSIVAQALPTFIVFAINLAIYVKLAKVRRSNIKFSANKRENTEEHRRFWGYVVATTVFLLLLVPSSIVNMVRLSMSVAAASSPSTSSSSSAAANFSMARTTDTPIKSGATNLHAIRVVHLSKFLSSFKDIAFAINFFIFYSMLPPFRLELHRLLRLNTKSDNSYDYESNSRKSTTCSPTLTDATDTSKMMEMQQSGNKWSPAK